MAEGSSLPGVSEGHEAHDPETIAALLDRDLTDADRAMGEAMVASCPGCAQLHADLMALTLAPTDLPVPGRSRDFVLSAEVAARLRSEVQREPPFAAARLSGDMTDATPAHSKHDRVLVASLVDRSISDDERARAEAQVAACNACARLHTDLVALSQATRELPTPSRPRDFTLTQQDAEGLRVRGLRRLLGFFGSAGDVFSRPLAIGLTTLGIAGLLVGTVPAAFSGLASGGATSLSAVGSSLDQRNSGGAGSAPEMAAQASAAPSEAPAYAPQASGEAAAQATTAPEVVAPVPAGSAGDANSTPPDVLFEGGEQTNLSGEPDASASGDLYQRLADEASAPSPLILAGGVLLAAGLILFALRWTARRLGAT